MRTMVVELGTGVDLHGQDPTKAAVRAVRNAFQHVSLPGLRQVAGVEDMSTVVVDVVIGVPSANRGRVEIEGLIGFFINTLALRVDVSGAVTVAELVQRVKASSLGAQAHQDLPFEQVVDLVRPSRSLDDLEVSSVKKKLKDKAFARSVNRDDIHQGVAELGVELDEHIRFCIDALRPVQKEIGLGAREG